MIQMQLLQKEKQYMYAEKFNNNNNEKRVKIHKLLSSLTLLGHESSGFILVLVMVLQGFLSLCWE